jgi:hypothetical protein
VQGHLAALNERLKAEHPDLPPFCIEHLAGAGSSDSMDLFAMFEHEIDLGDNKFRKVTGQVIRRQPLEERTVLIHTMDFSEYRP